MKSTLEERILKKPFLETYKTIKVRIIANGFLLLHEIDTQQIVLNHGVEITPLKQLLFFEPKYIAHIMDKDYMAINDIPLKIVIKYVDNETTSVSYQNPAGNLNDYNLEIKVIQELLTRIQGILKF